LEVEQHPPYQDSLRAGRRAASARRSVHPG
jgi:hypothetical protein